MRGARKIPLSAGAETTRPGFCNQHGQVVVRATGAASGVRTAQQVYRLRCTHCRQEYGTAGIDIKSRRCPACQQGTEGEPLRDSDRGPGLFS